MKHVVRISSAILAITLAFVVSTPTAHAVLLDSRQIKCQKAIASSALKYIQSQLKIRQKCIDANLKTPGSCTTPDADALAKAVTKMRDGIFSKCNFAPNNPTSNLETIGFPGPCPDANTLDDFTLTDLQDCIETTHRNLIIGVCVGGTNLGEGCTVVGDCPDSGPGTSCSSILATEYDPDIQAGPLTGTAASCQKEIAKSSAKYLISYLKAVQKCRNNLIDCKVIDLNLGTIECKLGGVLPERCATDVGPDLDDDPVKTKFANQKTVDAVDKARAKAEAAITSKCAVPADVVAIQACEPDQATGADAATCETGAHEDFADNIDPIFDDFLDFEYHKEGRCGDGRLNSSTEECDLPSDSACPGMCGPASGFFACLCQDKPRQRVIEHSNADLDNGWTGKSHDSGIVEGGGYVSDLYDCDGPGGPDVLCTVGPSCNNAPHGACNPAPGAIISANTLCAGVGNFCRKTAAASMGPHCENDVQLRCQKDGDCSNARCIKTNHGSPLPLSSGGVSVCVVNVFSEDVVGTSNLATGAGAVRLRQRSITHLGPSQNQPCPVCGGFCSGAGSATSPGARTLCTSDLDCPGSSCVTDLVCSYGPNIDVPCRPDPPYGGPSEFFGNPSGDCPPAPGANISGSGLDILFNPATTGSTSTSPTFNCTAAGFGDTRCYNGANNGKICTGAIDCPGGTCAEQCVCPPPVAGVGLASRPNACEAACVGAPNDAQPCVDDTDCAPGFCHPGDCRLNGLDTDSAQEGLCTVGPAIGTCSFSKFKTCNVDADCEDPICTFCQPGETCTFENQQCFVNGTITRAGVPGTPDRVSAALFCITATGTPSVDGVAGLPGPGAITQPATTMEVGF